MDLSKFPQIEKFDIKNMEHKTYRWPTSGRLHTCYSFWMLFNSLINALFVWSRMAFEDNPHWYSLALEAYMNIVYLFDMVRLFFTPVIVQSPDGQVYCHKLKDIARIYFRTWFFIDLFCFFPVAFLRSISRWEDGSKNDW